MSPIFSTRPVRLSVALEDIPLEKLLKSLRATARSATLATTDLCISQVSNLLEEDTAGDWSLREHRIRVLASFFTGTRVAALWHQRSPRSRHASLLRAAVAVQSGFQHGRQLPEEVVDWCAQACAAGPDDPTPWVVLIDAYRLLSYGQSDTFAAWSEVVARDRWNRGAYLSMLEYLSPAEAGSTMQMLEFTERVTRRAPADAACAAVELRLHAHQFRSLQVRGGTDAVMAGHYWYEHGPQGCLDRIRETWPAPGFLRHAQRLEDLNLLAYALISANRRKQAADVLNVINGRVTMWPWGQTEEHALSTFRTEHDRCSSLTR
ncbi:hypothetical protein ACFRAO_23730 [Streptomyces sp. NPDC056656]|uniref:hypothetical protein n=1 Tax=Streptomyces sp. NPDC056656 TaxID=3345895 RepID=UPI0036B9895B